jgi:hypothetical protein
MYNCNFIFNKEIGKEYFSTYLISVLFLVQEKNQKNMHLKRIAKILFSLHCNKITRPAEEGNNRRDSNRFCCGRFASRKFFNLPYRQAGAILLMCRQPLSLRLSLSLFGSGSASLGL